MKLDRWIGAMTALAVALVVTSLMLPACRVARAAEQPKAGAAGPAMPAPGDSVSPGDRALNTLDQASSEYKGSRAQHIVIQNALGTLQQISDAYTAYDQVIRSGGVLLSAGPAAVVIAPAPKAAKK